MWSAAETFANWLSWDVEHHGHSERYLDGDSVIVDSQSELDLRLLWVPWGHSQCR
jgi:hypothetical protein